jgi:p-hydroxybenzoate 3-monooxygenase
MVKVAIAGAGPAGLVIAHQLRRAGISFVLLERNSATNLSARPKAGLVEYRTVELLRDAGIAGPVVDFATTNHRCEFRTPDESAVLDYSALTGGRPHYIYPQHELVARLHAALTADGADIRCGHTVHEVRQGASGAVLSGTAEDGTPFQLSSEVAVGCEGSRSAVAAAMPGLHISEQVFGVRWLAAIGAAPPLDGHTVYGAHPRGFAGQMRRGPGHTRFYLEVPGTDTAADWPEDRIRDELADRLGVGGRLKEVRFGDAMFFDLRVRVAEPMQQGRLFLAGDAAHLITPAGGKGMNLAIQDAVELAAGLADRFGPDQDERRLTAYSQRRLAAIWRTQAFSDWFLRTILARVRGGDEPAAAVPGGFSRGLRDGWVRTLQHDPLLARWFAHAYAGVEPT